MLKEVFEIVRRVVVYDGSLGMLPGVTIAANGDLLVSYDTTIDAIAGGEAHLIRSTDGGQTWGAPQLVAQSKRPDGCIHLSVGLSTLSNGAVLLPYNDILGNGWRQRSKTASRELYIIKSLDNGHTWGHREPISTEPEVASSYGKIVELASGRLLCPVYGWYREGEARRTGVLKSDDGGETWGSYSTIAYDPEAGAVDTGHGIKRLGGFNEASLIELPGGDVLAIIRQALVGGDELRHLYRSTSSDGGESWSPPERLELCGTSPCLHISPSGRLMVGYRTHVHEDSGRTERGGKLFKTDGVATSWSEDEGRRWQGRLLLDDPKGYEYEAEYDAGYPAMVNLPNGEIFVAFYSYDEGLAVPSNFPEPYKMYVAANFLREAA